MTAAVITLDTRAEPDFARRAVLRLSSIEFWERYSFYNMFALLALFVSAPVARGGMGWSAGDAVRFFGTYLLIVQTAPVLGGWLADRWMSGWTALRLGALSLMIGHALLTGPSFIPKIVEWATGTPMLADLVRAGAQLGTFRLPAGMPASLALAHLLIALSFYGAVLFVAMGNGLFKTVLTIVIGRLPHANAGERDRAFTIFFLWSNIGGLGSVLFGGWLAERYGYGWAFLAAAVGMAISVLTMTVLAPRYIKPFIPAHGVGRARVADGATGSSAWIAGVAALLTVFIASSIASFQSYGMISLFTAKLVDRSVAGLTIPPAWFTALNPITIMVMTPVLLGMWRRRGLGHDWSATTKFAAGFALMAVAFLSLFVAASRAHGGGLGSPLWVIATIVIIALVELLTAPAIGATITRIVPGGRQAFVLGLSMAAAGVGAWISGLVGGHAVETGVAQVVALLAGGCVLATIVLRAFRRPLARLDV